MVASRPSGRAPPFQLVEGDRFNLCLGLCAAFSLAACKHLPAKHCTPFLRWQLNAYTNWNLAFIAIRYAMNQRQWEPFLLVNSLGIVSGFRTAFSQGLDENMRKKLAPMFRSEFGIDLPRWLFVTLDHLVHTLPAVVLSASILTRRRSVHPMNSVYVLMLYTWFSFRQSSTLDVSNIYVPHPWKRAWAGVLTALFVTPSLVSTPRVLGYAHHASCMKLRFFACAFPHNYACVGGCTLSGGRHQFSTPICYRPPLDYHATAMALGKTRPHLAQDVQLRVHARRQPSSVAATTDH